MEINIVHLYPDLLNTYGDLGNLWILRERAKARGIDVKIHNVSVLNDINECDLLFLGGGQDFEQSLVIEDLIKNKKQYIKDYIENEGVCLCICGGYQLLGEYYMSAAGEKLPGISILPIRTEAGHKRLIGNIIVQGENEIYVGFENHAGRTYIGDLKPFGKVLSGHGNNGEDGLEGCIYKNTYCTYMHGPLLSKNPILADELLIKALSKKYGNVTLNPLNDYYENQAKKAVLMRALPELCER
ncbi:MAG: glutamine amidotransferase [Bacillota bacterium]|nr:glutamine amidotransferase [Bacillota bacterium]